MVNNTKVILGIFIIVLAVFSGGVLKWQFDTDWTTLYSDDTVIAKEKWIVEAERTYFNLDSWYDKNVKCPKVIANGGYETATRCYYPDDYYEQLSRSLINTKIHFINNTNYFSIIKQSPNYKYGTRGAYAGFVSETMDFYNEVTKEDEFPFNYDVNWNPKDTRNYKLTWRIEKLKEIDIPNGIYNDCVYNFGKMNIDLKNECDILDYAEIKDGTKLYFHFLPTRGEQSLNVKFVDPVYSYPCNGTTHDVQVDFATVQAAIDDSGTVNGDIIKVTQSTIDTHLNINKSVCILGNNFLNVSSITINASNVYINNTIVTSYKANYPTAKDSTGIAILFGDVILRYITFINDVVASDGNSGSHNGGDGFGIYDVSTGGNILENITFKAVIAGDAYFDDGGAGNIGGDSYIYKGTSSDDNITNLLFNYSHCGDGSNGGSIGSIVRNGGDSGISSIFYSTGSDIIIDGFSNYGSNSVLGCNGGDGNRNGDTNTCAEGGLAQSMLYGIVISGITGNKIYNIDLYGNTVGIAGVSDCNDACWNPSNVDNMKLLDGLFNTLDNVTIYNYTGQSGQAGFCSNYDPGDCSSGGNGADAIIDITGIATNINDLTIHDIEAGNGGASSCVGIGANSQTGTYGSEVNLQISSPSNIANVTNVDVYNIYGSTGGAGGANVNKGASCTYTGTSGRIDITIGGLLNNIHIFNVTQDNGRTGGSSTSFYSSGGKVFDMSIDISPLEGSDNIYIDNITAGTGGFGYCDYNGASDGISADTNIDFATGSLYGINNLLVGDIIGGGNATGGADCTTVGHCGYANVFSNNINTYNTYSSQDTAFSGYKNITIGTLSATGWSQGWTVGYSNLDYFWWAFLPTPREIESYSYPHDSINIKWFTSGKTTGNFSVFSGTDRDNISNLIVNNNISTLCTNAVCEYDWNASSLDSEYYYIKINLSNWSNTVGLDNTTEVFSPNKYKLNSYSEIVTSDINTTNTDNYADNDLVGYCNATSYNGSNVTYVWRWWKNGIVFNDSNWLTKGTEAYSYYNYTSNPAIDPEKAYDGDSGTYATFDNTDMAFYNITLPIQGTTKIEEVRLKLRMGHYNTQFAFYCGDDASDKYGVKYLSQNMGGSSGTIFNYTVNITQTIAPDCLNVFENNVILVVENSNPANGARLYEFMDIEIVVAGGSVSNATLVNVDNISNANVSIADEWILECNSYLGELGLSKNSSTLTIDSFPIVTQSSRISPTVLNITNMTFLINGSSTFTNIEVSHSLPIYINSNISSGNTLDGYCNATNVEGTNVYYQYQWFRDGVLNSSGNTASNYTQGLEVNVNSVNLPTTNIGIWNFTCIGFDNRFNTSVGNKVNNTVVASVESVCIDYIYHNTTINKSCNYGELNTDLNMSEITFGKTLTSLNQSSVMFNYSGNDNNTFYIIAHEYDDVIGLSFTINGTNDIREVDVYINNTLTNETFIIEGDKSVFTFYGLSTSSLLEYYKAGYLVAYMYLEKDSNVTSSSVNITGIEKEYNEVASCTNCSMASAYDPDNDPMIQYMLSQQDMNLTSFSLRFASTNKINVTMVAGSTVAGSEYGTCTFEINGSSTTISLDNYPFYNCTINTGVNWHDKMYFGVKTGPSSTWYPTRLLLSGENTNSDGYLIEGYTNGSTYPDYDAFFILNATGVPKDISLFVGDNDTYFNTTSGIFNYTIQINEFTSDINNYLNNCTADDDGFCNVPLTIYNNGTGDINVSNLVVNITVNSNKIYLPTSTISAFLNKSNGVTNIPITIVSDNAGNITISDILYKYFGGNYSLILRAHNPSYSQEINKTITLYYTGWNYSLPPNIQYIDWYPWSPTAKDVTPFGQTASTPILTITNRGYGGYNMNWSMFINNQGSTCGELFISNSNDVSTRVRINDSWYDLLNDIAYEGEGQIWMWADLDCSYTNWYYWQPDYYFRACGYGVDYCSEEIS